MNQLRHPRRPPNVPLCVVVELTSMAKQSSFNVTDSFGYGISSISDDVYGNYSGGQPSFGFGDEDGSGYGRNSFITVMGSRPGTGDARPFVQLQRQSPLGPFMER